MGAYETKHMAKLQLASKSSQTEELVTNSDTNSDPTMNTMVMRTIVYLIYRQSSIFSLLTKEEPSVI